ncbi:MAG: Na(+)-translocating NADH-quinone reductase subunit A [Desulfobacterales bacterium]|nr:Na(+)-translocating NADH-quinone reductase subunit A [Desulfobacterales bacterium]
MMFKIKKGLDLPISGAPSTEFEMGAPVTRVALVGDDYVGMKPKMHVQVGDHVKLGQVLFEDKKTPGVLFTAPGCGKVVAVNRGAKRKFESIVIELAGEEEEAFPSFGLSELDHIDRGRVQEILIQSGMWTVLRTRPYSKVPAPDTSPHSIFVTAMDTNPLAVNPAAIISAQADDFHCGLKVLSRLTDGLVYVCKRPGVDIPGDDIANVSLQAFDGPHPAGLAGTHIHFLDPVNDQKTVWSINYQDVIAIGRQFATGRLYVDRIVSLAGPAIQNPRIIRTRVGAAIDELVRGELLEGGVRVISGSVLSGRQATGGYAFLGRPHLQISAIREGRPRDFLGWALPGFERFSVKALYATALFSRGRKFAFSSSAEGNPRAMVPIASYEKVMPLDIDPPYFLRALIIGDTEMAQALGCLELDEEDLALCSFVCPGKYNYGPFLREVLTRIEREG